MSKFSNLLKMIKLLEGAKEPVKRKEIAEYLGVSERMVRKYVDDIKEANLGIISTPGKNGGYQIQQEQKSRAAAKDIFTSEEMIYLKSMLNLNALDIAERLLKIAETNQVNQIELKILKNQNKTIENIYDKLMEE